MAQSLSCVYVHALFSTKDRLPTLAEPGFRNEMHSILGAYSGKLNCPTVLVGGVEDHVHILARLATTRSQADWIKELKRMSSIWAKNHVTTFNWQSGYGAFSVGLTELQTIRQYIENQETHHQKHTFQDEFLRLLREHGVTWDERYIWL